MTRPMMLDQFQRLPPALSVQRVDGLSAAIDRVAEAAHPSHAFLRYGWFAAALAAYGGDAATLVASREGLATAALPMVSVGPSILRMAAVPGSYWPFRSFPVSAEAGAEVGESLLSALGQKVNILRLGPVYDGDPGLELLRTAATAQGWAAIDRHVAQSHLLDMAEKRAEGSWPRNSTLRKNRFHEKHLGAHGALDWSFVDGRGWTSSMFDDLASIEDKSWIADRTDGRDAKFTAAGHGAFWRAAAADPVLADMMRAAVLRVDGAPTAFSFDIDAGALKYAIANSYDPAFAKHSPGKLLYYRNLVAALDRGITRVDWGAGDSGYKGTIGAAPGPAIRDWLFVRPGLPALLARMLGRFWRNSGQ